METLTPMPPVVSKPSTMSFFDALKAIQAGKKVFRISWGNDDYCFLNEKDGFLSIYTNHEPHSWLISEGDMEGEDWSILTELN